MTKKSTILFTHGGGRFANQLTNQAHFIAFAEENRQRIDVINLAFIPYAGYFNPNSSLEVPSDLTPFVRRLIRVVQKLFSRGRSNTITLLNQVIRVMHFTVGMLPGCQSLKIGIVPNFIQYLYGERLDSLDLPQYFDKRQNANITILAGWPIRCWNLFEKHQKSIRSRLNFNDQILQSIVPKMSTIKEKHEIVVGIFIRQSDYKYWNNGIYFYSIDEYMVWIEQVRRIMNDRTVGFIVVTESAFNIGVEQKDYIYHLNNTLEEKLNFAESMAVLSLCDYVLTPPSTFGIWAAFLGNVPIIPVYEKGQVISQSQFLANNLFDAINHPHMSVALQ